MIVAVAFSVSALACLAAFAASYLADNPGLVSLPALPRLRPAAALPAGPYFCAQTRRWRDPASKRFVAAPRG